MFRIESVLPIQPAPSGLKSSKIPIITFWGATQHLHYTSEAQRKELDALSHAEFEPSNETTAVLIPISKSAQWWELAQDSRQAHFHRRGKYEGHTAIGQKYVDRVFRRLYHSRHVGLSSTPYDFLTYFEFHSAHRDDFTKLLSELRNTVQNPEWAYVEQEYEIWMTKIA